MRLSNRARDLLVATGFLAVVGGLVAAGAVGRESAVDPDGGEMAPALTLPRIDGDTATLASLRGRAVVVNLWATWCPPCVREMPSLQRVYDRYRDEGLEILAVAVDNHPGVRQPDGRIVGIVSEFVDEYGLTFPVALDPSGETERRFGAEYLPTTFLIGRDGRIRATEVGGREWDQEPYLAMIQALLEGD